MRNSVQNYKEASQDKNENIENEQKSKIHIKASKRVMDLEKATDSREAIDYIALFQKSNCKIVYKREDSKIDILRRFYIHQPYAS